MPCDLTTGRELPCKDVMGGLKKAYFTTDELGDVTEVAGVISALAGTPEFFEWDLRGDGSTYIETITADKSTGTVFYSQDATLQFSRLDPLTREELLLIVKASPVVILEDYNGNFLVMGLENNVDAIGGTIVTGGARGDLTGYTLLLNGTERAAANFLANGIDVAIGTISAIKIPA